MSSVAFFLCPSLVHSANDTSQPTSAAPIEFGPLFWRVVEGIELPGQAVLDVRKLGFWASLNQPYRLPGPMAGWSSLGVLLLII